MMRRNQAQSGAIRRNQSRSELRREAITRSSEPIGGTHEIITRSSRDHPRSSEPIGGTHLLLEPFRHQRHHSPCVLAPGASVSLRVACGGAEGVIAHDQVDVT
jgi:hypothetical protein